MLVRSEREEKMARAPMIPDSNEVKVLNLNEWVKSINIRGSGTHRPAVSRQLL